MREEPDLEQESWESDGERPETFRVEASPAAARLDIFLRQRFPRISRGTIRRLIEQQAIRVDGHPTKPTHIPKVGEEISITWPVAQPATAQPQEIALEILYQDEELLVVNKPAGMVVHPAAGHTDHTLVNAVLHHCAGRLSGIGGVARPGIVHRLDKETSGCVAIAKDDATHYALAQQFARREVKKTYLALACGTMDREEGEIQAAIARHPSHRKRMAVTERDGREARTSYRIRERLPLATFVEVQLHTGRTHQIRVHFHHIGHPVVGDSLYGRRANHRLQTLSGYTAPRQMLHAESLTLTHPRTLETLAIDAPIPQDMREGLQRLRESPT